MYRNQTESAAHVDWSANSSERIRIRRCANGWRLCSGRSRRHQLSDSNPFDYATHCFNYTARYYHRTCNNNHRANDGTRVVSTISFFGFFIILLPLFRRLFKPLLHCKLLQYQWKRLHFPLKQRRRSKLPVCLWKPQLQLSKQLQHQQR